MFFKVGLSAAAALLFASNVLAGSEALGLWRGAVTPSAADRAQRLISPSKARYVDVDSEALAAARNQAPPESAALTDGLLLDIPMPDGQSVRFRLFETAVMATGLAARYPQIRTYVGQGVTDPTASARFDIGPRGFHGMVFSSAGTVYIDPLLRGDTTRYQVYRRSDFFRAGLAGDAVIQMEDRSTIVAQKAVDIGTQLRTYRLAMATTGEYAEFQDPPESATDTPDKAIVLAELVNVVNRVTGIYEREVGVRLQLVDGNDAAIFTRPLLDPYINDVGTLMLSSNTFVLNAVIGRGNYDIGHVVSTGGGGVAGLGVVCSALNKGAGVTGLTAPIGDPFYVDYVAHEIGHQFGANHTFNSETGSCAGGNRNASTAYEPGSASTIMGYAGICDEDDLQPHSDDYFHAVSYDEIVAFTTLGSGNSCADILPSGNLPPVVDAGTGEFTIPKLTPFELTGTASDPDGDSLSYQWEQFDLGAAGPAEEPDDTAPLFRSFLPVDNPTRIFPRPEDLLSNTHTIGELLPDRARELNFRFNVRDNRVAPSAGGVATDTLHFFVADVGPFLVLEPNDASEQQGGSNVVVRWEVAATDQAPVDCPSVDIFLSTDAGMSFDTKLAGATANDGEASVTLPSAGAEQARIKVKCANSVFFDVSDMNFKILPGASAPGGGSGGVWSVWTSLCLMLFAGLKRWVFRTEGAASR